MDVVRLHLLALLGAYGMIVFNFNVLAQPAQEFGSRVPDRDGILLWRSLHESQVGRLAVVVDDAPSNEMLEHWLKLNQIKAVMYEIIGTTEPKVKAEIVARIMAASGSRGMYLDTDPATVSNTMKEGLPSILVCQPFVIRQEWSSPKQMRSWDTLVTEVEQQALARSEKNWGEFD